MADTKKGRGWYGDSEGHARAGRKGGEATASQRGQSFYSEIGRKGGKSSSKKSRRSSEEDLMME